MSIAWQKAELSFGNKKILHQFSYTLPEKGVICFFGPSGCGKTTLLHTLNGLLKLQSGQILGLEQKKCAMVFQEDRLLPQLTAWQNIALVNEQETMLYLQKVGLAEFAQQKPTDFSGGMKRRLAIARAWAADSDLLLLDEPFTGLEESLASHIMAQIKLEVACKKPVILVTHDSQIAKKYSDFLVAVTGPPLQIAAQ